jgi:hypothetical protein
MSCRESRVVDVGWQADAVGHRAAAAIVSILLLVLASGTACGGPLGSQDRTTAVAYVPDGRMLVATKTYERPAKLWLAKPGDDLRAMAFAHCNPVMVLSMFSLSSGRVGLTVWCAEPEQVQLVALDLATGQVTVLAAAPSISESAWLERADLGVVEYASGLHSSGRGRCQGVGEVDGVGTIRPLRLTVALPTGPVSLATALPQPGASDCAARALARHPAVAANERYTAFFLHPCADGCAGTDQEYRDEWHVIVHDRTSGSSTVSPHRFGDPHGLAVTDDGALAISASYNDVTGVWYCQPHGCAQPRRLAKGTFLSPNLRNDNAELIAVENGGTEPTRIKVR